MVGDSSDSDIDSDIDSDGGRDPAARGADADGGGGGAGGLRAHRADDGAELLLAAHEPLPQARSVFVCVCV